MASPNFKLKPKVPVSGDHDLEGSKVFSYDPEGWKEDNALHIKNSIDMAQFDEATALHIGWACWESVTSCRVGSFHKIDLSARKRIASGANTLASQDADALKPFYDGKLFPPARTRIQLTKPARRQPLTRALFEVRARSERDQKREKERIRVEARRLAKADNYQQLLAIEKDRQMRRRIREECLSSKLPEGSGRFGPDVKKNKSSKDESAPKPQSQLVPFMDSCACELKRPEGSFAEKGKTFRRQSDSILMWQSAIAKQKRWQARWNKKGGDLANTVNHRRIFWNQTQ
jgi:hypothetical protein